MPNEDAVGHQEHQTTDTTTYKASFSFDCVNLLDPANHPMSVRVEHEQPNVGQGKADDAHQMMPRMKHLHYDTVAAVDHSNCEEQLA